MGGEFISSNNNDKVRSLSGECNGDEIPITNNYPCKDGDCYARGNFHVTCGACHCYKLNSDKTKK